MFHIEVRGLEKLRQVLAQAPENIQNGFDAAIGEVAEAIRGTASVLAPKRTGALAGSLYTVHVGLVDYSVQTDSPYARFVEFGTAPHMIYPRRAGGVLAFEAGGGMVFTRYVHHPGTWRRDFMAGAFEYHRGNLINTIKERVGEWLRWSEVQP